MTLLEELLESRPVLLDGAWGTALQPHCPPYLAPEELNLADPGVVRDLARAYVDAGSRVILTNTFGANSANLMEREVDAVEVNQAGAQIAQEAAAGRAWVFGSMGPLFRQSAGSLDEHTASLTYRLHAAVLEMADVGGLVLETMTTLEEARVMVPAARRTELPVVACISFLPSTPFSPEEAARELESLGADVIGANCGEGPAQMLEICRRLRAATKLPLWLKPNKGLPEKRPDGSLFYPMSTEEWVQGALALVDAGADLIGGCCGVGPEEIRALSSALKLRPAG